jgi:hypothetical protein
MIIYFGGPKEWYEKLTPCNVILLKRGKKGKTIVSV